MGATTAWILLAGIPAAFFAFYYLKIVPDLRRLADKQFPDRPIMRERGRAIAEIVDPGRVAWFDGEGYAGPASYEQLARKLIELTALSTAVGFRCNAAGNRRRLEATVGDQCFARYVNDSDWVDLKAVLPILNRALRVAGATGTLTAIHLTNDQGNQVAYVSESQRRELRRAGLLKPIQSIRHR